MSYIKKETSKFELQISSYFEHQHKTCKTYLIIVFLCLFLGLSTHLILGFCLVGRYIIGTEDWISVAQKHKKNKALSVLGNKILIVAGSNALFGISAETISQEIGIPTVNLAIHAGLDIKYILDDAKKSIAEGDIVLLPLEYSAYMWDGEISNTYLKHVLSNDPEYFHSLSTVEKFNHILKISNTDIVLSLFMNNIRQDVFFDLHKTLKTKCYTGFSFNGFGDELCNIGGKALDTLPVQFDIGENYKIDSHGIIEDFLNWCKHKKVKVLALYPVMQQKEQYHQKKYQLFFDDIKKYYQHNKIPILGDPYQATLQHNLMFDTHYHPNDIGRKIRTQQVISLIKPYI
ncbi:hypothetical protein VF14_09505 [Nostoc linckia z18]|uniref:Uncharacterized protein n=2 Tax=Nostoc linckia TaxID=92942 RepID=A0A9Q6ELV9_NOSLI|nr:hypothetical protein [Nostoc linckia]PHJ68060.1 hypothetical protein VF05_16330 [Nostoc linckia z3]PHK46861.1 hypothetical protein VF13_08530 [Nostoc linckia z16]PHJ61295.1 hypothetical protein VF02_20190 [Nostoc linckia z1]PHJ74387.1 hypothetical protein VF03_14355 [Nostoc linckia z2]PHJ80545.1 hypothetical protein VF06_22235 [Nostoc linckia z4]